MIEVNVLLNERTRRINTMTFGFNAISNGRIVDGKNFVDSVLLHLYVRDVTTLELCHKYDMTLREAKEKHYFVMINVYTGLFKTLGEYVKLGMIDETSESFKSDIKILHGLISDEDERLLVGVEARACFDLGVIVNGEDIPYVEVFNSIDNINDTYHSVIGLDDYNNKIDYYKETFFKTEENKRKGISYINQCDEIKTYLQLGKITL